MPEEMKNQGSVPKLGLALGGGGVRACMHLGFYEVLMENKIPVHCISGTSMGAIMGSALALGMPMQEIQEKVLKWMDLDLFSWKNFNYFNESLIKGNALKKQLDLLLGDKNFEDCVTPFACEAVDLESGNIVTFTEGPLVPAVSASSAFPGVLPPIFYKETYLVDGGVINSIPSTAARKIGAEKLISIGVKNNQVRQYISGQIFMKHYKLPVTQNVLKKRMGFWKRKKNDVKLWVNIILECVAIASACSEAKDLKEAAPDLMLEQTVEIDTFDFSRVDEAIQIGRELALRELDKIKRLMGMG